VARRLAHEIKNPLTPIQLSAERLQMKLSDKLAPSDQHFAISEPAESKSTNNPVVDWRNDPFAGTRLAKYAAGA
jgi:signal transduction histidine kinase